MSFLLLLCFVPVKVLSKNFVNSSSFQSIVYELHNARLHARLSTCPVVVTFKENTCTIAGKEEIDRFVLPFSVKEESEIKFNSEGVPYTPKTLYFDCGSGNIKKIIISRQGRIRYET